MDIISLVYQFFFLYYDLELKIFLIYFIEMSWTRNIFIKKKKKEGHKIYFENPF